MLQNRLITTPENVFYLTGFTGSFGFYIETEKGSQYLVTDGRYTTQAKTILASTKIELIHFSADFKSWASRQFTGEFQCEKSLTLSEFDRFKDWFGGATLIPTESLVEGSRQIKSTEEIEKISIAQNRVNEALIPFLKKELRVGVTERTLKFELDQHLSAEGYYGASFESIVAFGENSACPHYEPGERRLKPGDNILIDCGLTFGRYCSDVTRNFVFGSPTNEYMKRYWQLLKIQKACLKKYQAGVKVKLLDEYCRDLLDDQVEFYTHSLGHGVGLEVHEAPRISYRSEEVLAENQVVTCEPGLYYEGKFGIRIEDLLVVKKSGPVVLSQITKDLIAFDGVGNMEILCEASEV